MKTLASEQTRDTRKAVPLFKAALAWRRKVGGPIPRSIEDAIRNIHAYTMAHSRHLLNFLIACVLLTACGRKNVDVPEVPIDVHLNYTVSNPVYNGVRTWAVQLTIDKELDEDVVFTVLLDEFDNMVFTKRDVTIPVTMIAGKTYALLYHPSGASINAIPTNIRVTAKGAKHKYNVLIP